jgi:hypothetical protein
MRSNLILMFTAGALLVSAADFWKDKQPAQWSSKEVKRLLTNSPWAKEVTIAGGGSAMPGGGMGGRGGGGRRGGGGGMGGGMAGSGIGGADSSGVGGRGEGAEGGGMGAGGMEGGGAAMNAPRVIVRWETAAPIREASRAAEVPYAARIAEWQQQFYVITASGLPFGGRQQLDPERMRQMQQRLRSSASLTAKGKPPVSPEQVFVANGPSGATMIFLFPRSAAITAEDKDVAFETGGGQFQIKAKFNPHDMEYQGKLAL